MADYNVKLEIDDENGNPLEIDVNGRGLKLVLGERNESSLEFLVRNLDMITRIIHNKRCRLFADTSDPPTTKVFEGVMTDIDRRGTWNQNIRVFGRDFFKDKALSKIVNLKIIRDDEDWDVSTASLLNEKNLGNNAGVFFKPDGLKIYIMDFVGAQLEEYDLSTAWDVSTASSNQVFDVSAQETTPYGLFMRSDGLKFYTCGIDSDAVHEYDLSTAWDISTASFLQSFSISIDSLPRGVFFKPDGLKMYVAGGGGDDILEYDLSTAWDISTASFNQRSPVSIESEFYDVLFKPDGLKMYTVSATASVFEYDLSTAWDVSTASLLQAFNSGVSSNFLGVYIRSDGFKMYIAGSSVNRIYEYDIGDNVSHTSVNDGIDDILDTMDGSFTHNGLPASLPKMNFEFPDWMANDALEAIANQLNLSYYSKPDLDLDMYEAETQDSGITITETQVRDLSEVKQGIANSIGKVVVVGATDSNGDRIRVEVEDTTLSSDISGREIVIHDKTITTYIRAKFKALAVLARQGRTSIEVPPLDVRDLPSIPDPGETVTLNFPTYGLSNQALKVSQVEISPDLGTDTMKFIKLYFGKRDVGIEDRVFSVDETVQEEKRIGTTGDQVTVSELNQQKLLKANDTLTMSDSGLTALTPIQNFYLDAVPGGGDGVTFGLDARKGNQSELDV